MILRQFSSRQPYLLFAGPILTLSILLPAHYYNLLAYSFQDFPLDRVLLPISGHPWWMIAITVSLIIAGTLLSNLVFNRHEFNSTPTFVPGLLYAVISISLCLVKINIAGLLANVAVVIGINRLMEIFRQSNALPAYFKAAFWLGIGALCFPPYMLLLPGMLLSIINTRTFNWREHVLTILAFGTPFVYWLVWMFWTNRIDALVLFKKTISFNPTTGLPRWSDPFAQSFAVVIGVSFLLALRSFIFLSDRSSNQSRNVKRIFLIMSLFALGGAGFALAFMDVFIPEVAILPVTFIIGNWFTNYRYSLFAPFMFYAILITAAVLGLHIFQII